MITTKKSAAAVALPVLLGVIPAVRAQEHPTTTMSVCQARKTIVTELQEITPGIALTQGTPKKQIPSEIEVHAENIEFYADMCCGKEYGGRKYIVDLKNLGPVAVRDFDWSGSFFRKYHFWALRFDGDSSEPALMGLKWETSASAQAFADALNRLSAYARAYDPAKQRFARPCGEEAREGYWKDFQQKAATWRALTPRPSLAEDVRQPRLLAEDAFKQKQFETAAEEYEEGLEIDPLWPQGHFNAALLYAELKDYEDAIWHMRAYLELLPDAPDAQEARDQVLLWQGKMKQQETTAPK